MSLVLPQPTDSLASDNHAQLHRIIAVDNTAADQSLTVDADGDTVTKSTIQTRSGTVTRTSGYISSVALTGGKTLTITRDPTTNLITSITNGTNTWTFTRDTSNIITSWTVA